jgi:hypothetical protein
MGMPRPIKLCHVEKGSHSIVRELIREISELTRQEKLSGQSHAVSQTKEKLSCELFGFGCRELFAMVWLRG